MIELVLPPECMNLDCSNRVGSGKMVLVESERKVVGGFRYLRLLLCAPCAAALKGLISGG